MKKICSIFILFGLLFSLGLETLNIPPSAIAISTGGSGIGNPQDIWINPASVYINNTSKIKFTHFRWFGNIPINRIGLLWNRKYPQSFYLESSTINDLELYGKIPQSQPLGTFSTSWFSTIYSIGYSFSQIHTGISIRGIYSKLYIEQIFGLLTDLGVCYQYNKDTSLGFSIKNLGSIKSENLINNLPIQVGFGISYNEPIFNSAILFDLIQDNNHLTIIRSGLVKSFDKIKLMSGITLNNDVYMIGFGISSSYRNIQFNWSTLIHSTSTLGMPIYLDIVWNF